MASMGDVTIGERQDLVGFVGVGSRHCVLEYCSCYSWYTVAKGAFFTTGTVLRGVTF